jgi:hypothetical protein
MRSPRSRNGDFTCARSATESTARARSALMEATRLDAVVVNLSISIGEMFMKKLFAALIAAAFAGVTFTAIAADAPATPADKPAVEKKHKSKHHKKAAKKDQATPAATPAK